MIMSFNIKLCSLVESSLLITYGTGAAWADSSVRPGDVTRPTVETQVWTTRVLMLAVITEILVTTAGKSQITLGYHGYN